MSTTATVTEQPVDVFAVVSETEKYAVIKDLKKPEAAPGFGLLSEGNALWKASQPTKTKDEHGNEIEDISSITKEIMQTIDVTYPVFNSVAGAQSVIKDESILVALINAGAKTKLISQVRSRFATLTETNDLAEPEVTAISLDEANEIINDPLKRQKVSPVQKASKVLEALSHEEKMELLRSMGLL